VCVRLLNQTYLTLTTLHRWKIPLRLIWPTCPAFFYTCLFWLIGKERKKKGKCEDFTCNSKTDKISLVYHTNQTKKMKRAKQQKNRWAIKSENGHKNPWDSSENVRKTMVGRICGKGKFWVWRGTEMEWCIVKVMMIMIMMMMMNRWEKDELTVAGTHH